MNVYNNTTSNNLDLPPDSYIYNIIPTGSLKLAVISSDDSLRILDANTLSLSSNGIIPNVNRSVTCLKRVSEDGNVLATTGRDGKINCWDVRTGRNVLEIAAPKNEQLSALAWSGASNAIAAGVELDNPGEAPVYIWDMRNSSTPQLSLVESHSDTITELAFHPTAPTLLTGSTDALINIFSLTHTNEDDALQQTIPHSSAIHHAGFLSNNSVYALSTDERLSTYPLTTADSDTTVEPLHLGDMRERLACEYVVDVISSVGNNAPYIAAGSHTNQTLTLHGFPGTTTEGMQVVLQCAHGEEVVRDVYMDGGSETVFTVGEDGMVRTWRGESASASMKEKKSGKKGREKEGRFNPY